MDAAAVLSKTFEKKITVLAQALTSVPPKQVATRPKTPPAKHADVTALKQKMTNMEA